MSKPTPASDLLLALSAAAFALALAYHMGNPAAVGFVSFLQNK